MCKTNLASSRWLLAAAIRIFIMLFLKTLNSHYVHCSSTLYTLIPIPQRSINQRSSSHCHYAVKSAPVRDTHTYGGHEVALVKKLFISPPSTDTTNGSVSKQLLMGTAFDEQENACPNVRSGLNWPILFCACSVELVKLCTPQYFLEATTAVSDVERSPVSSVNFCYDSCIENEFNKRKFINTFELCTSYQLYSLLYLATPRNGTSYKSYCKVRALHSKTLVHRNVTSARFSVGVSVQVSGSAPDVLTRTLQRGGLTDFVSSEHRRLKHGTTLNTTWDTRATARSIRSNCLYSLSNVAPWKRGTCYLVTQVTSLPPTLLNSYLVYVGATVECVCTVFSNYDICCACCTLPGEHGSVYFMGALASDSHSSSRGVRYELTRAFSRRVCLLSRASNPYCGDQHHRLVMLKLTSGQSLYNSLHNNISLPPSKRLTRVSSRAPNHEYSLLSEMSAQRQQWTTRLTKVKQIISATRRLRLLLQMYQFHKHCNTGRTAYWRLYGKAFSSDTMGDGPPRKAWTPALLEDGTPPSAGRCIYVKWSTFPEASHPSWALFQDYDIQGIYQKCSGIHWGVFFPAIGVTHQLSNSWVNAHGNRLTSTRDIITKDCYLQTTTIANGSNEEPPNISRVTKRERTKKPVPKFTPCVDQIVYVDWSTFPAAQNSPLLEYQRPMIRGKYSKLTRGWQIYFASLNYHHTATQAWINAHGSQTTLPIGATVVPQHQLPTLGSLSQPTNPPTSSDSATDLSAGDGDVIVVTGNYIHEESKRAVNYDSTNLGISVMNKPKFHDDSLQLGLLFWSKGCGVNLFVDTQCATSRHSFMEKTWKNLAGSQASIHFSAQGTSTANKVGGQLALLDAYWSRRLIKTWSDPSLLGLVYELKMSTHEGVVRIISVYWPVPSREDTGSLGELTQAWLRSQHRHISTDDYMLQLIRARLAKPANRHILMGDFNHGKNDILGMNFGLNDAHEGYNFHSRFLGNLSSRIDFLLHSGTPPVLSGYSVDSKWQEYSDHRPIWAIFPSAGHKAHIRKQPSRRIAKTFKDGNEIEQYHADMAVDNFSAIQHSGDCVEQISIAAKEFGSEEAAHRPIHLWSPYTAAYIIRQETLANLLLCAKGPIPARIARCSAILRSAKDRTISIGTDGENIWERLGSDPSLLTQTQLRNATINGYRSSLEADLRETTRQLHGRKCKQRLELIWDRVRKIREHTTRFFTTMGVRRIPLDLSRLHINNTILTNPQEIDQQLACHWQSAGTAPQIAHNLWESLTNLEFHAMAPDVPAPLKDLIWSSLRSVPTETRDTVANSLSWEKITPTIAEFHQLLNSSSKKSAGGPTGATYRLIQLLPLPTKELLFGSMLKCWEARDLPAFWNNKLLYPLAKKQNTHSMKNIRPIILLEVSRKLWFKIISRKILAALESASALQSNQYGFRAKHSTSDNLIQFINALEATAGSNLFGTTFDIVGAFNAPPRPWLEFALRRLGVPQEIANILAYLDDFEAISILTPHRATTRQGATFNTGRGCGQGDVTSPLLWTVFFDIVLTTLNTVPSGITFADSRMEVHDVKDTAFADDLLSISSTITNIQQKADIMSACAIALGFQLATDKFRTFSMMGGGEVTLHTDGWTPLVVPCSLRGFITYLGVTLDIGGGAAEESKRLIATVVETINRIHCKTHSAAHSQQYANRSTAPKLAYRAKHNIIPPSIQRRCQILLAKEFKHHAHVSSSFPGAILHAPLDMGGLGLTSTTDSIGQSKWHLLQRALASSIPATRWAAESILNRSTESSNTNLLRDTSVVVHREDIWLSDITRLFTAISSRLVHNHGLTTNSLDTPLPNITPEMERLGLCRTWDVVHWVAGRLVPISPSQLNLPHHSWPSHTWWGTDPAVLLLAPGQIWATSDRPETLHKIIGWKGNDLLTKSYTTTLPTTSRTRQVTLNFTADKQQLVNAADLTHKCILSSTGKLCHLAPMRGQRRIPYHTSAPVFIRPFNTLVATDGTYQPSEGLFGEFRPATTHGGIALVNGSPPFQRLAGFRVRLPVTQERAFSSEQAALNWGLRMYNSTIQSDCQGAISSILSTTRRITAASAAHPHRSRIQWTRSHPERRRDRSLWTPEDHAIYQADMIAEGEGDYDDYSFATVTDICLRNSRLWAPINAEGMLMEPPLRLKQRQDLEQYLVSRTKFDRAIWSSAGLKLLLSLAHTIPQRGALAKLHLSQFQADFQYSAGTRPPCRCGCRDILSDWLGPCTRSDVIELNDTFSPGLSTLDIPEKMAQLLYHLLSGPDNVALFRGIWTVSHQSQMIAAFTASAAAGATAPTWTRGISTITKFLTSHSLKLYHLISSTKVEPTPVIIPPSPPNIQRFFQMAVPPQPITLPPPVPPASTTQIFSTPIIITAAYNPVRVPRAKKGKIKTTATSTTTTLPSTSTISTTATTSTTTTASTKKNKKNNHRSITQFFSPLLPLSLEAPTHDRAVATAIMKTFKAPVECVVLVPYVVRTLPEYFPLRDRSVEDRRITHKRRKLAHGVSVPVFNDYSPTNTDILITSPITHTPAYVNITSSHDLSFSVHNSSTTLPVTRECSIMYIPNNTSTTSASDTHIT